MNINANVKVYFHGALVDDPYNIIRLLLDMRKENMATLQEVKDAVAANRTVTGSAVELLNGLTTKIQELIDSGADPVALQAVLDEVTADTDELSAAVSANTPSGEPPVEEPPVENPPIV